MKMNFSKKMVVALLATFISAAAFAQDNKGEMSFGANLNFSSHSDVNNMGLGVKFRWVALDKFRLEPSFNYYFPKKEEGVTYNMWDLSVNVHYLLNFPKLEKFTFYPIGGLGILGTKAKIEGVNLGVISTPSISDSSTDVALNLGGGCDYKFNNKLTFNAEIKYQVVADWDRPIFTLGFTYNL